jgi:hypothetical protein
MWRKKQQDTHPRMLSRAVKDDQKGHGVTYSVRQFLKTAYVMTPPIRGSTGGVVFRINLRISGF